MHFSVENDTGSAIQLWLVPDNPSTPPRVRVTAGSSQSVVATATEYRAALKSAGVHETGICGFTINEQVAPGLSTARRLTIHDCESGLLLYQRTGGTDYTPGRLFRLETRIVSHGQLDSGLGGSFHMSYPRLERLPVETVKSILHISYAESIYASGRVPFPAIHGVLKKMKFKTAILLVDPYREVFARLALVLDRKMPDEAAAEIMPPRVRAEIAQALAGVAISDIEGVNSAISSIHPELIRYISDPLTRQLADIEQGAALNQSDGQRALRTIAEFDAVGLESDPGYFIETAFAVLGRSPSINMAVGTGPDPALSERLRSLAGFRKLVRLDGPIFDAVTEAMEALPDEDDRTDQPTPLLSFNSSGNRG
jgi:hypothetical protein